MPENQLVKDQATNIQPLEEQSQQVETKSKSQSFFSKWIARLHPARLRESLKQKFSDLTLSQWFYLVAGIILFMSAEQDVEAGSPLMWVGIIAGIGLMRELWYVFNRMWDSILGRGFILVLYAATANFAIAIAALKVNAITGIEPTPFVFTIGFTTLLMLPFWLLMSSIVFFSVALVVSNLWLILSVLLRVIRIKVQVHWEDRSFVFATMLLRVILIQYVIQSMFLIAVPFAEQIEIMGSPVAKIQKAFSNQEQSTELTNDVSEEPAVAIEVEVEPSVNELESPEKSTSKGIFDQLIANFIYHFETYPKSACKKAANQRGLPIDENLILLVEQDDSTLGYHFFVGPCEGNYTAPVNQ